jgi:poly-gamma-glutamate capsule biosynthesis protein CapA/YwtB (metallophosphatase superfamily)
MHRKIAASVSFLIAASSAFAEPYPDSWKPLNTACSAPLRANFTGDLFLDDQRFTPDALNNIAPLLRWADFNVVNLEGSIVKNSQRAFPDFPFANVISAEVPGLLKSNRILFVTRANNHSMDFGADGINQTSRALAAENIAWTGAGSNSVEAEKPLTLKHNNIKIAVLAFSAMFPKESWATKNSAGTLYPTPSVVEHNIQKARLSHDFVVTAFHWGGELTTELRPYQRGLAQLALDSGADLVIGHHAHIAQGIDRKADKVIAWGLGNFLFSSTGKSPTMSLILSAEFCKGADGKNAIQTTFTPIATTTRESQNKVVLMTLSTFRKFGADYERSELFAPETRFFLPSEGRSRTWMEWNFIPVQTSTQR